MGDPGPARAALPAARRRPQRPYSSPGPSRGAGSSIDAGVGAPARKLAPTTAARCGCCGRAWARLAAAFSTNEARLRVWAAVLSLAALTGALSWAMVSFIAVVLNARFDLVDGYFDAGNVAGGAFAAAGIAAALVLPAAAGVVLLAPLAGGSGLPEIAVFLNGASVEGALHFRTLVVKVLGICLVIAAGVPVGREGPMVFIGGTLAWHIGRILMPVTFRRKQYVIEGRPETARLLDEDDAETAPLSPAAAGSDRLGSTDTLLTPPQPASTPVAVTTVARMTESGYMTEDEVLITQRVHPSRPGRELDNIHKRAIVDNLNKHIVEMPPEATQVGVVPDYGGGSPRAAGLLSRLHPAAANKLREAAASVSVPLRAAEHALSSVPLPRVPRLSGAVPPGTTRVYADTIQIPEDERRLVSYGGAAGISAAFNSPVGGVLYVMEEVSSWWDKSMTFRAFVGSSLAAFVVVLLLTATEGNVPSSGLTIFSTQTGAAEPESDWQLNDIPWIIMLGAAGGVVSALFSRVALVITALRRRARWRRPAWVKIVEAVAHTALVVLLINIIPLAGQCREMVETDVHDHHRAFVQYTCSPIEVGTGKAAGGGDAAGSPPGSIERYNDLATLYLKGEEGAIRQLFARDTDDTIFSPTTLVIFFFTYLALSVSVVGLPIPMGHFVPMLLSGAALGRLMGQGVRAIYGESEHGDHHSPGAYAEIGAAAFLGGFTRMSIAVTVLLVEATRDVSVLLPETLAIIVARMFAWLVLRRSFNEVVLDLKKVDFMHEKPPQARYHLAACDVMKPVVHDGGPVAVLGVHMRVSQLCRMLRASPAQVVFPVARPAAGATVRDDTCGSLVGIIYRSRVVRRLNDTIERSRAEGLRGKAARHADVALGSEVDHAPYVVSLRTPLHRVQRLYRRLRLQHVVVLNAEGGPAGVIGRKQILSGGAAAEAVAAGRGGEATGAAEETASSPKRMPHTPAAVVFAVRDEMRGAVRDATLGGPLAGVKDDGAPASPRSVQFDDMLCASDNEEDDDAGAKAEERGLLQQSLGEDGESSSMYERSDSGGQCRVAARLPRRPSVLHAEEAGALELGELDASVSGSEQNTIVLQREAEDRRLPLATLFTRAASMVSLSGKGKEKVASENAERAEREALEGRLDELDEASSSEDEYSTGGAGGAKLAGGEGELGDAASEGNGRQSLARPGVARGTGVPHGASSDGHGTAASRALILHPTLSGTLSAKTMPGSGGDTSAGGNTDGGSPASQDAAADTLATMAQTRQWVEATGAAGEAAAGSEGDDAPDVMFAHSD